MPANLKLANTTDGKRVTFSWGSDGNPQWDDAQSECVLSLLNELPWFADRVGKRQSKLPTVKTIDANTASKLQQFARDALQPAIDDGRLRSVAPRVATSGSGYVITVSYVTAAGVSSSVSKNLSV